MRKKNDTLKKLMLCALVALPAGIASRADAQLPGSSGISPSTIMPSSGSAIETTPTVQSDAVRSRETVNTIGEDRFDDRSTNYRAGNRMQDENIGAGMRIDSGRQDNAGRGLKILEAEKNGKVKAPNNVRFDREPEETVVPAREPTYSIAGYDTTTVMQVQRALNDEGANLKEDGLMNLETREALRQFNDKYEIDGGTRITRATLQQMGINY